MPDRMTVMRIEDVASLNCPACGRNWFHLNVRYRRTKWWQFWIEGGQDGYMQVACSVCKYKWNEKMGVRSESETETDRPPPAS